MNFVFFSTFLRASSHFKVSKALLISSRSMFYSYSFDNIAYFVTTLNVKTNYFVLLLLIYAFSVIGTIFSYSFPEILYIRYIARIFYLSADSRMTGPELSSCYFSLPVLLCTGVKCPVFNFFGIYSGYFLFYFTRCVISMFSSYMFTSTSCDTFQRLYGCLYISFGENESFSSLR